MGLSTLLGNVYKILDRATGIQVGQIAATSQVVSQFGFQVSGGAVGYTVKVSISNDGANWSPLAYFYSDGFFPVIDWPCVYMKAETTAAPTSGEVTVTVSVK
jgi:hypothetical protein